MNHIKQVIKDSLSLVNAQVIIALVSILYLTVIARLLTKEELAVVASLYILLGIVSLLSYMGLPDTAIREVPSLITRSEFFKAGRIIKATLFYPFLFGLILSIIFFLKAELISKLLLKSDVHILQIKIIAGLVPVTNLLNLLMGILQSLQRFLQKSSVLIFSSFAPKIGALGLFFCLGINGYLIGWGFGVILSIFLAFYFCRDHLLAKSGVANFKPLFKFSYPYYFTGFARYSFSNLDSLIVGLWFSPKILALYYVCRRFVDFVHQLINSLMEPYCLKIAELKAKGLKKIEKALYLGTKPLIYLVISGGMILASASYFLLNVVGGSKYLEGFPVLTLLVFALIFYSFFNFFTLFVYVLDKPKKRLYIEIMVGLTQIFLLMGLIKILGILGVALAILLSFVIGLGVSYKMTKKILKIKLNKASLIKATLFSIMAAGIIIGLQKIYYQIYIVPFYIILGGLFFFFISLFTLKKEDWQLLRDFLPSFIFNLLPFKK